MAKKRIIEDDVSTLPISDRRIPSILIGPVGRGKYHTKDELFDGTTVDGVCSYEEIIKRIPHSSDNALNGIPVGHWFTIIEMSPEMYEYAPPSIKTDPMIVEIVIKKGMEYLVVKYAYLFPSYFFKKRR